MSCKISLALCVIAAFAVTGCARDTLRQMPSLKDTSVTPASKKRDRSAQASEDKAVSKAETETADAEDEAEKRAVSEAVKGESKIETGSTTAEQECQGAHIAYQATRRYIKDFGPRPEDEPGSPGPCQHRARSQQGNE